jgi:nitroreductase
LGEKAGFNRPAFFILLWKYMKSVENIVIIGYTDKTVFKEKKMKTQKKAMPKKPDTLQPIRLLKPEFKGGKTVCDALRKRKTVREIGNKKISMQQLSNLLWAAGGINRKKGPFGIPGRTAATASNSQEIDIYVLKQEGAYLYDPAAHSLVPVAAGDFRAMGIGRGQAPAGAEAPVRLVFVADIDKFINTAGFQEPGLRDPERQKAYYYADTGLMAGNVYLFAASAGLAAWFHNCDREGLRSKLKLRPDQLALFGQTVGYPDKS